MSSSKNSSYKNVVKGRLVLKGHGAVKLPKSHAKANSSTVTSSTSAGSTSTPHSLATEESKSSKSSQTNLVKDSEAQESLGLKRKEVLSSTNSNEKDPSLNNGEEIQGEPKRVKTKAEEEMERIQALRFEKLAKERASKTYRETIEEFNAAIGSLSEHHDIPKVGPG